MSHQGAKFRPFAAKPRKRPTQAEIDRAKRRLQYSPRDYDGSDQEDEDE